MSRATDKAGTKSYWRKHPTKETPYGVKAVRNWNEKSNARKKS